jgi:hypothetical protein
MTMSHSEKLSAAECSLSSISQHSIPSYIHSKGRYCESLFSNRSPLRVHETTHAYFETVLRAPQSGQYIIILTRGCDTRSCQQISERLQLFVAMQPAGHVERLDLAARGRRMPLMSFLNCVSFLRGDGTAQI